MASRGGSERTAEPRPVWRLIRRIAVGITGFGVVAFSVALFVPPGPGILVMPLGAILATEFPWARKLLRAVHNELRRLKARASRCGPPRKGL